MLITQYNLPPFSTQIHETFLTHVHLPTNLMSLPHMRHLPLTNVDELFSSCKSGDSKLLQEPYSSLRGIDTSIPLLV